MARRARPHLAVVVEHSREFEDLGMAAVAVPHEGVLVLALPGRRVPHLDANAGGRKGLLTPKDAPGLDDKLIGTGEGV